jgi:HSP20 family protein
MTFNILPWHRPSSIDVHHEKNPFGSLQQEINRLFDDFFGEPSAVMPSSARSRSLFSPATDIVESENGYKVRAELPGMDDDDIEVTVNDNYLTIKGEKKESKDDKGDHYVRRERYYGSYQRTIALPETADADKVHAEFRKGVLTVEIPKKAEAVKPSRKVEVKNAA